jgi:CBS domain-containing protein
MLRLKDIMTRDVLTVSPELSVRDAMEVLTSRHISGAPVVANGKVVGVVSLTDLAESAAATPGVPTQRPDIAEWGEFEAPLEWIEGDEPTSAFFAEMWEDAGADVVERMAEAMGPEWNMLEDLTVSETMNRKVSALPPDTPVEAAADLMRRAAIHRVLVMEDGKLLGVVTTKDITDAVADHRFTNRVYVFGANAGERGT